MIMTLFLALFWELNACKLNNDHFLNFRKIKGERGKESVV